METNYFEISTMQRAGQLSFGRQALSIRRDWTFCRRRRQVWTLIEIEKKVPPETTTTIAVVVFLELQVDCGLSFCAASLCGRLMIGKLQLISPVDCTLNDFWSSLQTSARAHRGKETGRRMLSSSSSLASASASWSSPTPVAHRRPINGHFLRLACDLQV